MEVSFLKDAIDRVAEMAKPFTFEFAGRQFCSAELHEIRPEVDFPARYSVDTLDALVKLIRTEGAHYSPLLYVRAWTAPGGWWWIPHTPAQNGQHLPARLYMKP